MKEEKTNSTITPEGTVLEQKSAPSSEKENDTLKSVTVTPKCLACGVKLINASPIGYLHPPPEDGKDRDHRCFDGTLIDPDVRYEWDKKYGRPKESYDEVEYERDQILEIWHRQIKEKKEEVEKWKEEMQILEEMWKTQSKEMIKLKQNLQNIENEGLLSHLKRKLQR